MTYVRGFAELWKARAFQRTKSVNGCNTRVHLGDEGGFDVYWSVRIVRPRTAERV